MSLVFLNKPDLDFFTSNENNVFPWKTLDFNFYLSGLVFMAYQTL